MKSANFFNIGREQKYKGNAYRTFMIVFAVGVPDNSATCWRDVNTASGSWCACAAVNCCSFRGVFVVHELNDVIYIYILSRMTLVVVVTKFGEFGHKKLAITRLVQEIWLKFWQCRVALPRAYRPIIIALQFDLFFCDFVPMVIVDCWGYTLKPSPFNSAFCEHLPVLRCTTSKRYPASWSSLQRWASRA